MYLLTLKVWTCPYYSSVILQNNFADKGKYLNICVDFWMIGKIKGEKKEILWYDTYW